MEQDLLISRLFEILQEAQDNQAQTKIAFERLQVALSGVFRLLSNEEDSLLKKMRGSPQDMKGYAIRLVSEIHQDMMNRWETLGSKLEQVLQSVRKS